MQIDDLVDFDEVPQVHHGRLTYRQRTPLNDEHKTRVRVFKALDDGSSDRVESGFRQKDIFSQATGHRLLGMNSIKRSRTFNAPVASTRSVNYKTVNRTITLSGREFVSDLIKSVPFAQTTRLLRPTDSQLFSWLAGIARKFEEFKFSNLRFIYEPQCPSTDPGQIGLFFDGDPTHLPPANWNNFINTGANSHGAVWAPQSFVVPSWLYASRKSYYTINEFGDQNANAAQVLSTPTDPLEYFPGLFGFVSEGCSGTAGVAGKVYLEYTVTFKTQNVDGFNLTSTAGTLISGEEVVNSGYGYYEQLKTFPLINAFIFGGPLPATPLTYNAKAGSVYFKPITVQNVVGWRCVQDVTLLYVTRITAGAGITATPQGAILTATGAIGAYATLTLLTYDTNGGMALAITTNEAAANDRTQAFQLKLKQGMFFQVLVDQVPTYCHNVFAPYAFAING